MAGEACNKIALMKIGGETVGEAPTWACPAMSTEATANVLYGQAWVDVTAEDKDKYPF